MSSTTEPQAPEPTSGQITIDRRLAWGLASAVAIAIGSVGTWVTAGPFSVAGTTGGGDGWITLGIGVVAALLVGFRRLPWLTLPGAIVAIGIGIGDAVRFLGIDGGDWFSVSIGWGLVLTIVASASLAAWGTTALPSAPRVPAAALVALALAGAIALGVTDRTDTNDDQAAPTLFDAADQDETSGDDENAEPADWDTSTETDEAEPAADADTATEADPAADADASSTTTEQAAASDDCNALGINSEVGNEGACADADGRKYRVVNRSTTLALNEIVVRDVSVNMTPELPGELSGPHRASGRWAQITMTIRNETSQPITVDRAQFGLLTGEAQYSTDFEAMNEPGSCIWGAEEVQPGNEVTCWIAFDVAKKNASRVTRDGNLTVLQPSDTYNPEPEHRMGVVRLYR
jgi:hypothetical protein